MPGKRDTPWAATGFPPTTSVGTLAAGTHREVQHQGSMDPQRGPGALCPAALAPSRRRLHGWSSKSMPGTALSQQNGHSWHGCRRSSVQSTSPPELMMRVPMRPGLCGVRSGLERPSHVCVGETANLVVINLHSMSDHVCRLVLSHREAFQTHVNLHDSLSRLRHSFSSLVPHRSAPLSAPFSRPNGRRCACATTQALSPFGRVNNCRLGPSGCSELTHWIRA